MSLLGNKKADSCEVLTIIGLLICTQMPALGHCFALETFLLACLCPGPVVFTFICVNGGIYYIAGCHLCFTFDRTSFMHMI